MSAKRAFPIIALAALAVLLARTVIDLGAGTAGLTGEVQRELAASGVTHPVTAVLLNFRAYDTWLELIVLLLAAVAALQGRFQAPAIASRLARDPLVAWLVVLLVPLAVLTGGYLLEAGAYAPGGAFQGGAVLAAGIVLLHLAGRETSALISTSRLSALLVLAAGLFLVAAITGLLFVGSLLEYPAGYAGAAVLVLETAATVSIAVALALVVVGQIGRGA
jgi:multisubunit Na+/H+ antiporter MnhB subunit